MTPSVPTRAGADGTFSFVEEMPLAPQINLIILNLSKFQFESTPDRPITQVPQVRLGKLSISDAIPKGLGGFHPPKAL